MQVPLSRPCVGTDELKAVQSVLESGWLTRGPKCEEFEELFAAYVGCKFALSANSCTSALFLVLKALGIRGEVILPSFTFVATANTVVVAGATPVFADIKYESCTLDPKHVEHLISPQTEAIIPVHFAGQSCWIEEIVNIGDQHGLAVIEDSAEAVGATFKGRMTGSWGRAGCFSFFPTKNMTTGEGGMVVSDDAVLIERCRRLSAHGLMSVGGSPWDRSANEAGFNMRMPDVLAAIGVVQLRKLNNMNFRRQKLAAFFNSKLPKDLLDLPLPVESKKHVYQMYTTKTKSIDRNALVANLNRRGVCASVHFDPPVHLQPLYINRDQHLEVTERVAKSILTLPIFPDMTNAQADFVVDATKEAIAECGSR